MREIVEAFNFMDTLIDEEIGCREDEITGCLEGGDDPYEFGMDVLSFDKDKLVEFVEGWLLNQFMV